MNPNAKKIAVALFGFMLLAGCSGDPTKEGEDQASAVVDSREGGKGSGGESATTSGAAGHEGQDATALTGDGSGYGSWRGKSLDDPTSPLSVRTIYFDFDSIDIRSEYIEVLRAHGQYLSENPNVKILIEGHCDERGTREYNLALGERRSHMIKRFIMAEGVADAQLDGLSYGEERPVDPGEGEGAWAQNRRAEIVY